MRRFSIAAALLPFASCASAGLGLAQPSTEAALQAPPPGQVLVNFHRPSDRHGGTTQVVFDRYTVIGETLGEQRFQYVCDPGSHVFIAQTFRALSTPVSVVLGELQADRVYDVLIEPEGLRPRLLLTPLSRTDPRRAQLADWEAETTLVAMQRNEASRDYERELKPTLTEILRESRDVRMNRSGRLMAADHR